MKIAVVPNMWLEGIASDILTANLVAASPKKISKRIATFIANIFWSVWVGFRL